MGRPVSTYELYRQYALDCLGLANKTNDFSTKTLLVDMAQAWVKLAEQAAKNAEGQQSRGVDTVRKYSRATVELPIS